MSHQPLLLCEAVALLGAGGFLTDWEAARVLLVFDAAAVLTFTGFADILDWALALEPVDLAVPLVFEAGLDWAVCFGDAFFF